MIGMVTAMDEQIGNIIKDLKSTGHYNNSVIVFTTDVRKYFNLFFNLCFIIQVVAIAFILTYSYLIGAQWPTVSHQHFQRQSMHICS